MRQIAHLSDLHFGTEDFRVTRGLLEDLMARPPDLVAISGDLTQRARAHEFLAAQKFLREIARPLVVVPGNHDIPLYNVAARFLNPLAGYRRYITADLHPIYQDQEMVVAGTNTARSNTWKNGRISLAQIERLREQFSMAATTPLKVLVAHHPFIPHELERGAALVGRLPVALRTLEECGCDLILAGHLHRAYSGDQGAYHLERRRSILIVQAGTAISHRRRDEPNSYNRIDYDRDQLRLEVRGWQGERFEMLTVKHFQRHDDGWKPISS